MSTWMGTYEGAVGTYDSSQVRIDISLVHENGEAYGIPVEIVGFDEDEFVSVVRNQNLYEAKVGSRGEISRSRTPDRSAIITMMLQHNSPSVGQLNAWISDDVTGNTPLLKISIIDPAANDDIKTSIGWLHKDADHGWGDTVGSRAYEFYAVDIDTKPKGFLDIAGFINRAVTAFS